MNVIRPPLWDYSLSRFTAWAISDYHPPTADKIAVAAMVLGHQPDIILTSGDNSEAGNFAVSMAVYQDWVDRQLVYPCPGNHDQTSPWGVPDYCASYFDYFTYLNRLYYYQLSLGPLDIFFLNSWGLNPDGYASTSPMANWLAERISQSTAAWKAAIFHPTAYSSANVHGSATWMQWPVLSQLNFVISGHDHVYERNLVGSTYYFTNGMAGSPMYGFGTPLPTSQFRYNSLHGAMRLDVMPNRLTLQFINVDGVLIDSVTLIK